MVYFNTVWSWTPLHLGITLHLKKKIIKKKIINPLHLETEDREETPILEKQRGGVDD